MKNNRVLLGMSGGVDSTVSALLLKKQGYEVIGVSLNLVDDKINEDAKKMAEKLGIEFYMYDGQKVFNKNVVDKFVESYLDTQTPNPCVECNKYIKFGLLNSLAKDFNCDNIATGHYANVEYCEKFKKYLLKKSKADTKDQTYFLHAIDKEVIQKILFPLSDFASKDEIRKIAQDNNLEVYKKPDSQEICFIPNDDYVCFIKNKTKQDFKSGNIKLDNGEILGKHTGLIYYTIGQRKGLGIAYKEPLFVIKLDKQKNEVIVGTKDKLFSKQLYANNLNFFIDIKEDEILEVKAKIRYRANPANAKVSFKLDKYGNTLAKVEFEEEQRAITKGQSVVFYIDDYVIGGGKII